MSIAIWFEGSAPPFAVRDAVVALYGLDPERVAVLPPDGPVGYAGPDPIVLITLPERASGFNLQLVAGREFTAIAQVSALVIARQVCRQLGVRALVDDDSVYPDYWYLVTRDGSYGRVFVDPDAADDSEMLILYAFEPIDGEPELPVVPLPDWAKNW